MNCIFPTHANIRCYPEFDELEAVILSSLCIQSIPQRGKKVSEFLDYLQRRGATAFQTFIRALVFTDQENIALTVDEQLARKFMAERGQQP